MALMENLSHAAKSGDHRRLLEAMRDRLAADMENCSPMVVAQIAGRLQDVARELDSIPHSTEESKSDELATARANRRAKASAIGGAATGGK